MPILASRSTVLASCGLLAAGVLLGGCGGGSTQAAPPAPSTAAPRATTTPSDPTPGPVSVPASTSAAVASPSTGPSTASHPAVAAGPVPCPSARLGITVRANAGGGAAGSLYEDVVFVNQGDVTCTLNGHPGVSYVAGTDGHQVGAPAGRTGVPVAVTLAPRASAHAQLQVVNYGNYDLDTCQPSPVDGFRVYPPDQTAAAFIAGPGTTCADPSIVLLTVGPVEPGTTD